MIFSTVENKTNAFGWNTALRFELEKGVQLSDYTELEEEFDAETLQETYNYVLEKTNGLTMQAPTLMTVTDGKNKSCRVWIDKSLLKAQPDIKDLRKGVLDFTEH